jgi:ATP-dependent DNA helicase RecQ
METPAMPPAAPRYSLSDLKRVIEQHWGFRTLRPLQEPAMRAVLEGRDSVVVLPTGGGKSLCYQAPAVLRGDTTVVVSPLIALMKDQVDSLRDCGVPAIRIDSSLSPEERFINELEVREGNIRLLFVSPERLVLTDFCGLLRRAGVRTFAIDESHCISHWGHDFRPEYRQLSRIKELFPEASVHAYTATATEQVRKDIAEQLCLRSPEVLVGSFDRPNLTYRVLPRHNLTKQVLDVLDRHAGEAGIIYCLRRLDVDELAALLQQKGYKARAYHAGLSSEERKAAQDAFAAEACDLIVATVAFGMGIDRSNLRFVLHTAMPKSVEHYQQEAGRAGRDGLEAECVLLHSGGDFVSWKRILEKSAQEPGVDPSFLPSALRHLDDIDRYCRGVVCRHKALVEYFGQAFEALACGACDLCLGDTEALADALIVAQKILSCVARVEERFGAGHVISVLRGEDNEKVRKFGHDRLSTYGLLRDHSTADVRDWIHQLLSQKVLAQEMLILSSGQQVPLLKLNEASWEVMRGQRPVRLLQLVRRKKGEKAERSQADAVSWEGVDRGLFDALREVRRQVALASRKAPYLIFGDATLRELARVRPSTRERMRLVYGVGDSKLRDYSETFLTALHDYCRDHDLALDEPGSAPRPEELRRPAASRPNAQRDLAFALFAKGTAVEEVVRHTGRARATVMDYLAEYVREARPRSITAWVPELLYQRVAQAARRVGIERLKPIFLHLGEEVSYDDIRLVVNHLTAGGEPQRDRP